MEADVSALAIGQSPRFLSLRIAARSAASERVFKISTRYFAALFQVPLGRLPKRHFVYAAHLLMRLSTENRRPSSRRGQRRGCS